MGAQPPLQSPVSLYSQPASCLLAFLPLPIIDVSSVILFSVSASLAYTMTIVDGWEGGVPCQFWRVA